MPINNGVTNQKGTPAFYSDTFANRPAFGYAGRVFISTDSGQIFEDTGTAWTLIADAGVGGGTLSSVCLNGNTTASGIVITANGLSSNSMTNTSTTAGSILFAGTSGLQSQDNTNLFWDNTNKYLGIGPTGAPTAPLDIHSSTANVLVQLNATATNNSNLAFLNANVGKWRIGNLYNAGANSFQIFDVLNSTARLTILNTGVTTLNGDFNATSATLSNRLTFANAGNNYIYGGNQKFAFAATSVAKNYLFSGGAGGLGIYNQAETTQIASITDNGNASFVNVLVASADITNTTDRGFVLSYGGSSSSRSWRIINDITTYNNFQIQQSNSQFGTTYTTKFIIDSTGNVGIGTSAPDTITNYGGLTINGTNGAFTYWNINGTDTGRIITDSASMYFDNLSTGDLVFRTTSGATERAKITSGGNFGIGTATPSYKLSVQGPVLGTAISWTDAANNTGYLSIRGGAAAIGADNNIVFETAATEKMRLSTTGVLTITNIGSGTVTATAGVLSAVSDMNLKIEDGFVENALEKVMNLKPRYYHWKKESGLPTDLRQLGFYAQEVNQALGEEAANTPKTEKDKWGIYDRGMIAFLTAAIQEQQKQIEELKLKIK